MKEPPPSFLDQNNEEAVLESLQTTAAKVRSLAHMTRVRHGAFRPATVAARESEGKAHNQGSQHEHFDVYVDAVCLTYRRKRNEILFLIKKNSHNNSVVYLFLSI